MRLGSASTLRPADPIDEGTRRSSGSEVFRDYTRPSATSRSTAWLRDDTPSLRYSEPTWQRMVLREMKRRAPISGIVSCVGSRGNQAQLGGRQGSGPPGAGRR